MQVTRRYGLRLVSKAHGTENWTGLCSSPIGGIKQCRDPSCGDAFPIEGVLVATYLLSVEALPHCRCGVANKNRIV